MGGWARRCAFVVAAVLSGSLALACPEICSCTDGTVDCDSKGLYYVPEDMSDGDGDTVLLAFNQISTLGALTFYTQQHLDHLELQNNVIVNIDTDAFHGLSNLTYLDLSSNQLSSISLDVLQPLSNLSMLHLGNNKIVSLAGDMPDSFTGLQVLYLQNNALMGLSGDLLGNLPSLVHLRLDGNVWACTCQNLAMVNWLDANSQKIEERNRTWCSFPEDMAHFPLLDVHVDSFQHCDELFTPVEYFFFLCVGLILFASSIVLCLVVSVMTTSYRRFQRHRVDNQVYVYKKSTRVTDRSDVITYGHHLPVINA
ncbi:hypothetical protein GDO86_020309 [Hymenochirus boettgeri]|uniref:Uncharacterized protein n=1 Tax=Hymenochirus boettgeri TaxID=247094 RepID=A0A8T2IG00_9PIPI|nr:hypothetical protein GDO86_020309 [Hymenochirus boettgeri]